MKCAEALGKALMLPSNVRARACLIHVFLSTDLLFVPNLSAIYRNLGTDKEKHRFYKEVLILSQLRHPNIITLFGFVRKEDGAIMMVTELMTGGTLYANTDAPSNCFFLHCF